MNGDCKLEDTIAQRILAGEIDATLKAHLALCHACRRSAAVSQAMHELAVAPESPAELPDPTVIWLKAQLMSTVKTDLRRTATMGVANAAIYVVVAASWTALLSWKWDALRRLFSEADFSQLISAGAVISPIFLMVGAFLLIATLALTLHTVLADE